MASATDIVGIIISHCLLFYWISCYFAGRKYRENDRPVDDFYQIGYIRPVEVKIKEESYVRPVANVAKPNKVKLKADPKVKSFVEQAPKLVEKLPEFKKGVLEASSRANNDAPRQVKKPSPVTVSVDEHVLALVAVGYKKTVAKSIVKDFFSKNKYIPVEQFIIEFFKKDTKC